MKLKIILTSLLLFLFSSSVYAGMCFPKSQVYINTKTQVEKFISCNSVLGRLTQPLLTNSFVKSGLSYDSVIVCGGKDTTNLRQLTFQDFSTLDKVKIIINALFFVIIILLPLGLFLLIYSHIKSLALRIILDVVFILVYINWLLVIIRLFGACA